ncbi:MAG TPA: hypothetical protein VGB94_13775 [Acidobacteriaceae bacterium]
MKVLFATISSSLLFVAALPMRAATSQVGEPHELMGFLLRQSPDAFATLGKPFKEGSHGNGTTYQAFHIPNAKETYLVAIFAKVATSAKAQAITLELTGTDYGGPTGFLGLKLGEDASSVEALLGKPSASSHENDVNLDLWDYKQKNYSLEFTANHKLYSIQIVDEIKSKPESSAGATEVHDYALAIQKVDVDKLMQMSSGELECTQKNEAFGFNASSARAELANHNGSLSKCLNIAAKEILRLGSTMKGADDQLRLYEKALYMGAVTKFPKTSPLKEVVFQWETDRWRVYEVTFR